MSAWDPYIKILEAVEGVEKAAIFGLDGSKYASSCGLNISEAEVKALLGSAEQQRMSGVHLNGLKYFVLRCDEDCMLLKSKKDDNDKCRNASVGKTKTLIVIGIGTTEANGGQVNGIMKTVKYLCDAGY